MKTFKLQESLREHTTAERIIWCAENAYCDYVVMKDDDEVHFTDFAQPGRLKLLRSPQPISSAEQLLAFAEQDYAQNNWS